MWGVHNCVAKVMYLVSFESNLPLLSRNPNFTLTEREEETNTHTWTEKKKKKRKPLGGNEMFHFSKYKLLFFFFKQTILISSLHFMNIHTQRVLFTGLANYSMWCQYVLWKALLQFATPHVLQAVPAQNKWVIMSNCSNYKCKVRSVQ